jgi:Skp family chaperone for outer membrane proteins
MFPPAMQKRGEPLETAPSPAALIDAAKVVVVATSAQASEVQAKLDSQFQPIQSAPNFRVWLRK